MALFRKPTDEELIEKWAKEDQRMLRKNYSVLPHQNEYPAKAYLLKPDKLEAISYEPKGSDLYIYIEYRKNFSNHITKTLRVSYERIFKGTLICAEIKQIQKLPYAANSSIIHSLFTSYKDLTVPVSQELSLHVRCKKIYIDNFDIYAMHNNELLPEDQFREILKQQLER